MDPSGRKSFRGPAGFSIVELLVVISLIGIVTSLAIWRTGPALERAKVRRAATVLAADLQYAQMLAARQRAPVVFIVNPSLRMYQIRDRGSTTVFRERLLGSDSDYGVEALTADPTDAVEIFPNGVATQTVTFTLDLRTHSRQVKLSRAGQIRILTP